MADPGALSAAAAQITFTSGLGPYTLDRALGDHKLISDVYADGAILTYHVTDDSGMMEVNRGVFTAPNTLSRATLVLSSTGSPIDWPATGQRIVTPLLNGIPICDTPPTAGQVLAWDAVNMEYCPADGIPICDTPPTDGQVLAWDAVNEEYCPVDVETGPDDDTCDMQDIYSGTSV